MLDLSPADHYAHYALGRALEKQGKESEANGHFKLASSLRPQNEHYASRILDLDRDEPDTSPGAGEQSAQIRRCRLTDARGVHRYRRSQRVVGGNPHPGGDARASTSS